MSDIEFEYKGRKYFYEVDGYKVFGLVDDEGNDIDDDGVYNAACEDLVNQQADQADMLRDDIKENGPISDTPCKVRFP